MHTFSTTADFPKNHFGMRVFSDLMTPRKGKDFAYLFRITNFAGF
jgi:hypothetical protein